MIAAVDHAQKCVWGWGQNRQQAHDHAIAERSEKRPGVTWVNLEYCDLMPGANLDDGGFEAYRHIIRQGSAEIQADMFAG